MSLFGNIDPTSIRKVYLEILMREEEFTEQDIADMNSIVEELREESTPFRSVPPDAAGVARKYDAEKVRYELMSVPALNAIAEVMTFGACKYESHNWRRGFLWSRLLGATLRHVLAYMGGEDRDPESGLSHLAHAGCCLMFLLEHEICKLGTDDRYRTVKVSETTDAIPPRK